MHGERKGSCSTTWISLLTNTSGPHAPPSTMTSAAGAFAKVIRGERRVEPSRTMFYYWIQTWRVGLAGGKQQITGSVARFPPSTEDLMQQMFGRATTAVRWDRAEEDAGAWRHFQRIGILRRIGHEQAIPCTHPGIGTH
jgi:hypothetical protein